MPNKYVNFISDQHLLKCIENLHLAYTKAKNNISKKSFYSNKVDTIKLSFDAKFNSISEDDLIQSEILRQIDKSINNSIGTFPEEILGGINGYEVGKLSGFDMKAVDNTLFAIFGKKEVSHSVFPFILFFCVRKAFQHIFVVCSHRPAFTASLLPAIVDEMKSSRVQSSKHCHLLNNVNLSFNSVSGI